MFSIQPLLLYQILASHDTLTTHQVDGGEKRPRIKTNAAKGAKAHRSTAQDSTPRHGTAQHTYLPLLQLVVPLVRVGLEERSLHLGTFLVEQVDREEVPFSAGVAPRAHVRFLGHPSELVTFRFVSFGVTFRFIRRCAKELRRPRGGGEENRQRIWSADTPYEY